MLQIAAVDRIRAAFLPYAYLLFRVGVGVIMVLFGLDKLNNTEQWVGFLAHNSVPFPEVSVWLAIAGEVLGGAGLVVGLLTPFAALGVFFTMLVAFLTFHLPNGFAFKDDWGPLVLMVVALHIFARGGGELSLDALLAKKSVVAQGSRAAA